MLGNGAILTNVCMLPLYPEMVAYLAASSRGERRGGVSAWLGVLVLAGVLTLMTAIGFVLYLLRQSFGTILPVLLPLVYGTVVLLGVLVLAGRNPFATARILGPPAFRSPHAAAFMYGLLLGPMTLPCAGPLLVSAFVIGAGSVTSLADCLLYSPAFGLGFGWPLILLPVLAAPAQRRFTQSLGRHYKLFMRASVALLVGIGLFGAWTDVLPSFGLLTGR